MNAKNHGVTAATLGALALLAGCAGQPQTYTVVEPSAPPQQVTMPGGTVTGAASATEAQTLAQMVATGNNNAMAQFDKMGGQMSSLQATENKELKTSQDALAKLEQLSMQQGSGSITLFFAEGSDRLDQFQYQRLVNFLDYLARESRGRKVILVSIGSASAVGSPTINRKLSQERAQAPLPTIQQYLVNTPHQIFKVSAIGDMYAPKNASLQVDQRYQSVRIVAAYDAAQLPGS